MKRHGFLFDRIVAFDNLTEAARKAFRGQKDRPAVARMYFHQETELWQLQEELVSGAYRPRPYHVFEIREPKRREICAADIRDRVVHHAICNLLGPIFESRMISDTFACRPGKGTHAAVRRAQAMAQHHRYFLQCDVRKYFSSISHEVLKAMLRRQIKDARVVELLDLIIDHPLPAATGPGRGLPIGNLTSQYFANLYLGELDHFVKERLRVGGYLRYMDDFILFGSDKRSLRERLQTVREFVTGELRLELKEEATIIAPVGQGASFLGFRVFPQLVKLSGEKWRRFRHRVRKLEEDFSAGLISEDELARSVGSMLGHIRHADTLAARRNFFDPSVSGWM